MILDKELSILEKGVEAYQNYAMGKIFIVEYGLKDLLETILLDIQDIPKFEVYIAIETIQKAIVLFKKNDEEKIDVLELAFDDWKINLELVARNIGDKLNIRRDDLFVQDDYVQIKNGPLYHIYLIIHTKNYFEYIGLNHYYKRFAICYMNSLTLKKYSLNSCREIVDMTIRDIYILFFNYREKKIVPQFSLITRLSAMTYENNKCNARLICPSEVKHLDIKIATPVILTAHNLRAVRKLLEIASDELAMIIYWRNEEGNPFPVFEIFGFSRIEQYEDCARFEIFGYLQWRLLDKKKTVLTYKQGGYIVCKETEVNYVYIEQCLKNLFGSIADVKHIESIIENAWQQSHGTTLIVSSSALEEVSRLCDNNRGYQIKELDFHAQYNLVNNITAVDGAIMIDEAGLCFGIGIILDGESVVKGNSSRGARFNSAYNYIAIMKKNKKNAIAVVVSEDRTIDIITSKDEFEFSKI